MYSVEVYLDYCRLQKIRAKQGYDKNLRLDIKNQILEIEERLPAPERVIGKSFDDNWRDIIKKMDRGIREKLCFEIPPDDHVNFFIEFCKRYEKRYGLRFQIHDDYTEGAVPTMNSLVPPISPSNAFDEITFEEMNKLENYFAQDETEDPFAGFKSLENSETEDRPRQMTPEEWEHTFNLQIKTRPTGPKRKPISSGAGKRKIYISDGAYQKLHHLPYEKTGQEKNNNTVSNVPPTSIKDWVGKLVVYENKVYRVLDVCYNGRELLIDKETPCSDTTEVSPSDLRLF